MTLLKAVPKQKYTKKCKRSKLPKIKHFKISVLKKEYDFIYSWWIRLEDCTANGYNKCFTCHKVFKVIDLQCGHYWSRINSILRYDKRNTKPQCSICNCSIFGKGKPQEFALGLEIEYGGTILQDLEALKQQDCKFKWYELQTEIDRYTVLVKDKLEKFPEIEISEKLKRFFCSQCKQTVFEPNCIGCRYLSEKKN